ncbi:hypothetical protein F01_390012 [Burkholderia cenocepacia]|nr:hypothetical protein F01_390012 [Burkholderia cenocepacia]
MKMQDDVFDAPGSLPAPMDQNKVAKLGPEALIREGSGVTELHCTM